MKELRDSWYIYYQFTIDKIGDVLVSRSGGEFGYIKHKLEQVDDISYPLFNCAGYEIGDEEQLVKYLRE